MPGGSHEVALSNPGDRQHRQRAVDAGGACGWFADLPAAVPDTGPFNSHFVRDLGVVFTVCGVGFAWCAENLEEALPVHLGITAFYAGHAATHVADILSGRLPASHWWIDMPAVFAPTVLLVLMAFGLPRSPRPTASS